MTDQRIIIEMGMGNDLYGQDYQKAAARAIQDALRHSSLPLFETLNIPHSDMRVQVTIGVADPDQIDTAALAGTLPRGQASVTAVKGGLNTTNPDSGNTIVIATAAVEAFLPNQSQAWRVTPASSG